MEPYGCWRRSVANRAFSTAMALKFASEPVEYIAQQLLPAPVREEGALDPSMSADFWAGYISGAASIVIGNPLDIIKVRVQASASPAKCSTSELGRSPLPPPTSNSLSRLLRPWITGTAAPVLGYGALNALLFVSYNRTEAALGRSLGIEGTTGAHLGTTWLAGAAGDLATWVVSTPTELIKCRAQLASPPTSSWSVARQVLVTEGIRGLYFGGLITALRDSIGYGFYFWSYELSSRWIAGDRSTTGLSGGQETSGGGLLSADAAKGAIMWWISGHYNMGLHFPS